MITIENGVLVDPGAEREGEFDLLIEAGKVKAVEKRGAFKALDVKERVDAKGLLITPGLIDLHVHLREPGYEWKETVATGSRAAVLGGYTSICCMPNTKPINDTAQVTEFILERARAAGLAKVLPIGAVSLSSKGKQMAPLSELKHAGCVAFSDDGEPVYDAGLMRRALEWAKMLNCPISAHEEDKSLSCGGCMNESALSVKLGLKGMPGVAEDVMVSRDIELARFSGARVHICHVSTARSIELIRRAKRDGIPVTCEVTPHHLVLNEEMVSKYDTNSKMSPPLREETERLGLIEGLKDGTIDAIASDHAPHDKDSKTVEFSEATFGILGLQTSLPLILQFVSAGTISMRRAVELLSFNPARCFNLNAGTLKAGMPADIAIIDPKFSWVFTDDVVASISKNSPFFGRELHGRADTVIVDGKIVIRGGK